MSQPQIRHGRRAALIALVALIGVLVYAYSAASVGGGFPLDDAWIHQTYARNLALSGQWAYTPGLPSAGSTAPLYTLILALGYLLGVDYQVWAYLVGWVGLTATGIIAAALADRLFPTLRAAGLWAGLAVVSSWQMVWAGISGMEIPFSAALATLILLLAVDQLRDGLTPLRCGRDGLLFGLATAALITLRPEGALLGGLVGLAMLINRPQPDFTPLAMWVGGAAIGGLIGLGPYFALNFTLNGSPFPTTAAAKQAEYAVLLARGPIRNFFEVIGPALLGAQLALLPGLPLATIRLWRGGRGQMLKLLPLLWALGLAVLYTVRLPVGYHHGRYLMPALPGLIVIGCGGVLLLVTNRALLRRSLAVKALQISALALPVAFFVLGYGGVSGNVLSINSEMRPAAAWVAQRIPPHELLAVHDIGAVGYFANSPAAPRPILDLAGLVSPEVIPLFHNPAGMAALMAERNVRWLMVLPDQWEALWGEPPFAYAEGFCLRFNADGLMGGMRIYEFDATGACP